MSLVFPISPELSFGFLSTFLIVVIVHSLRDSWKISGHSMAYVGVSTTLYILSPIFILSFIFFPLVVWSRLKLKRHTFSQILAGAAVGIFTPILINLII
jgi:membrane-associated phospholipid phosphatase